MTPEQQQKQADIAMLRYSVDRIAQSPIGKDPKYRDVIRLLQQFSARGKIRYANVSELDDDRGGWNGDEILINEDYRGNLGKTMPTLIHEAAHAAWRIAHPIGPKHRESPDEGGENEYHSVLAETLLYKWLRDVAKLAQPEYEMDRRVERLDNGTLRATTIQNYKNSLQDSQDRARKLMQEAGQ